MIKRIFLLIAGVLLAGNVFAQGNGFSQQGFNNGAQPCLANGSVPCATSQAQVFTNGVTSKGPTSTQTITPGEESISTASSVTPSGSYKVTYMANTQGAAGFSVINPTTPPTIDGQTWILKISSTAVQTFSWGTDYDGGTLGLPVNTLGTSTIEYFYFVWDEVNGKFDYTGHVGGF